MIDAATLRQGDEIVVRAIVDRVTGSNIHAHVGNSFATLALCDVVGRVGETVRLGARTYAVLSRDDGWLWLRHGDCRMAVPEGWVAAQQSEVVR